MSRSARFLRRSLLVVAASALVGCSTCSTSCTSGLTLQVRSLMGIMHPGSAIDVQVCFDGECKKVQVSRKYTPSGRVFLPFKGVNSPSDHVIDITGPGGLKGHYAGPLDTVTEKKGCASCKLATINVSDSGSLQPGIVPTTTAPATTAKGG